MTLALEQRKCRLDRRIDHAVQRDDPLLEVEFALRDARDIEKIVQQPGHMLDLTLDHALRPFQLLAAQPGRAQHLRGVADRRKGVAQFVRQGRQKHVLAPIRLAQRNLGFLSVGIIKHHADISHRYAGFVVQEPAQYAQPAHRSGVDANDPVFV